MSIFLAPHNDDEALFGSYIIQRTQSEIVVCTNGTTHEKFGVTAKMRKEESQAAAKVLGVPITFLGIDETKLNRDILIRELKARDIFSNCECDETDIVFAPRLQGGNRQHDLISNVAQELWGKRVIFYSTYSKDSLEPEGQMPLTPTTEEETKKQEALACFVSQIKINPHHFEAIKGKLEYLSFAP